MECIRDVRISATGHPSPSFIKNGGLCGVEYSPEGVSVTGQGLALIGETKNQEELPSSFSLVLYGAPMLPERLSLSLGKELDCADHTFGQ